MLLRRFPDTVLVSRTDTLLPRVAMRETYRTRLAKVLERIAPVS